MYISLETKLGIGLLVGYSVVLLLVLHQLMRGFIFRHSLWSFQFGFLGLCAVWLAFRVAWFSMNFDSHSGLLITGIILAPNVCQITTFSLLVLYFARLYHRRAWAEFKRGLSTCYCVSVRRLPSFRVVVILSVSLFMS
jgi:hypothetical protein